jgi:5-methylcytosine-specific restriction enzyme subunit McrC
MSVATLTELPPGARKIGRIPVRNLWLLMLYASDLVRYRGLFHALLEKDLEDLPELIAKLLASEVDKRLRRNLSRGYRTRAAVLERVRGRIDTLKTYSWQLFARGEVACRFDDLTIDTPRNRLVRSALDLMGGLVRQGNESLSHACRTLAKDLGRLGVGGLRPSNMEVTTDQIGRHEAQDKPMVALSRLAFDLALPTEEAGPTSLMTPEREEAWVRRLFERAVGGFYEVELAPSGWLVRRGMRLGWQKSTGSPGMGAIMPGMTTDIMLDSPAHERRIVIDTKFTSIVTSGRFKEEILKSVYIYQIYAYLRSQENLDSLWNLAEGLLLHPAIGTDVDEWAIIQGHKIRFATIDLTQTTRRIQDTLRALVLDDNRYRLLANEAPRPRGPPLTAASASSPPTQ